VRTTKFSPAQMRALQAVKAGRVFHRHPHTWVLSLDDIDTVRVSTLDILIRRRAIRVKISDALPEYTFDRQVIVTDDGERAMANGRL
jgi:hypothetical protein